MATTYTTPDPDCPDCEGHGYDAFLCDGHGHEPVEVQRCDSCACGTPADDDAAAVRFVRELEQANPWAVRVARQLLEEA